MAAGAVAKNIAPLVAGGGGGEAGGETGALCVELIRPHAIRAPVLSWTTTIFPSMAAASRPVSIVGPSAAA